MDIDKPEVCVLNSFDMILANMISGRGYGYRRTQGMCIQSI